MLVPEYTVAVLTNAAAAAAVRSRSPAKTVACSACYWTTEQ